VAGTTHCFETKFLNVLFKLGKGTKDGAKTPHKTPSAGAHTARRECHPDKRMN
jgi:hypothetical protein